MSCDCEVEIKDQSEKNVLYILLGVNIFMFFVEIVTGWIAQSTGLIADSLDMFADAAVYAVSLYAVGRSLAIKSKAALLSGILQLALGVLVVTDVARRILLGSHPDSLLMISISLIALAANTYCTLLISKHKDGEVHMRASWIFTKNDMLANLGVVTGGIIVRFSGSPVPDLVIGGAIALLILYGGYRILQESLEELKNSQENTCKTS